MRNVMTRVKRQCAMFLAAVMVLSVALSNCNLAVYAEDEVTTPIFLSDIEWISASSSWKTVNKDLNCNGDSSSTIRLNIGGTVTSFEKGLGACADSEIIYDISAYSQGLAAGKELRFQSWVGIDYFKTDAAKNGDGVYFMVYGDGVLLYTSALLDTNSEAEYIDINVTGITNLTLYMDKNVTTGHDNGDWADAKLVVQESIAATDVTLSDSEVAVNAGDEAVITAAVTPENATDRVTWSSSNTSVATVTGSVVNGVYTCTIKALVPGTASITATAGSITKTCAVTVNAVPVTSLTLNKTSYTMFEGSSYTLSTTIAPSNATDKTLEWTSSDPAIATVGTNGKVTAVSAGDVTITATTKDGSNIKASCAITVAKLVIEVTSITLNKSETTLLAGEKEQLNAVVLPENATDNAIVWSTDNEKAATVDADGMVTAVAAGTAVITAKAQDGSGVIGICTVTVNNAEPETYKIIYQLDGGKNDSSNPETYKSGTTVTLKDPTRAKYVFAGWYADSAFKTKITSISGKDVTVYAKWTQVTVGKAKIKSLKNSKSKQAKLNLKKVKDAKGYQIVYAKNAKLTKGKKKVTNESASPTIKKLKKGTTYYFKVRAYKLDSTGKKIYGKFSKARKIKITK